MASSRALVVEIIGDDRSLQRAYKRSAEGTARLNQEVGRVTRGVAAGSGVFRSLGRSLAFASGGFIAAAGAADLIRGSIRQASEAAATQKQLAAQFRVSGQNLAQYRDQIDKATRSVSLLAGFEDDQLTQAFTTAFRGSQNVSVALKIQATAADVARGRHIDLQAATLALTKAYGGQTTALRRLGILVPAQLDGLNALNFVQQKFAGQARAGTTEQERFSAAFKNFEEVVGTALLPTFNKLLGSLSKWLDNTENQKKVQHGVSTAVKITTGILTTGAHAVDGYRMAWDAWANTMHKIFGPGIIEPKVPGLAGPVGTPATTGPPVGVVGPLGRRGGNRASLDFQISVAQEKLAQAQLTAGLRDDRAKLVSLEALTRRKIASTKDLGDRTKLYQDLGSIDSQIKAIDDKAAADQKTRHDQEIQARKDKAAKEAAQQKKIREAIQAQSDKVNSEFKRMLDAQKAAAAKLKARLKAATDAVRQQIGDLFTGPILNPTDAANKGILGVTGGGGPTIGTLTRDVVAQTAGFITRNADLARLARAGAPGTLLKQLRDSGDSALIHTLATGSKAAQSRLFKAVSAQEKVIQQIAHADIQARTVVVHSGNVRHSATTPNSQRRGRGAGVVQGGYLRGD